MASAADARYTERMEFLQAFDVKTLERAFGYARGGNVLYLSGSPHTVLLAEVSNGRGEVYQQRIRIKGPEVVDGDCTCPVGFNCKHVAAALIAWSKKRVEPAPQPTGLPQDVRTWFAAARLHGDDTTVPLLARGGTKTARLWTYVRDDRPFDGTAPPAVVFRFSPDRAGEHPTKHLSDWQGILQADAYAGYNQLYDAGRQPGPVASALCWSHARRKFFELADVQTNIRKGQSAKEISPIAVEAVKRIAVLFEIERKVSGLSAKARLEMRQSQSAPLVTDLEQWLRSERALLSKHAKVAKAIDYLLSPNHWPAFTQFLEDGRICLTNNAAERSLRDVALGRKSWLFAGSERGGQRAAAMYTLIGTAKLNDIDPQAWLADVIARISDTPVSRLHELLPWNWKLAGNTESAVKPA